MHWRRSGDKPLSKPMMVSLPTHICVTRPQWVKVGIRGVGLILYQFDSWSSDIYYLHTYHRQEQATSRRLQYYRHNGWPPPTCCGGHSFRVVYPEWCRVDDHQARCHRSQHRQGCTEHLQGPIDTLCQEGQCKQGTETKQKVCYGESSWSLLWTGFNPQTVNRGSFKFTSNLQFSSDQHNACSIPQKWCSKHSPSLYEYVVAKAPPTNSKKYSKGHRGAHWSRSLSVPLPAFVVDNQMVFHSMKNVYMSSKIVFHKVSNWSAMATRNISMHLLQLLLASCGQAFKLTQRASLGLRGLRCFCIFYENVQSISTHIQLYWSFFLVFGN